MDRPPAGGSKRQRKDGDVMTKLRRLVPAGVWMWVSKLYWRWHNRGRHRFAAAFNPQQVNNRRRIRNFRDRHHGERCFIIGNGPSLKMTDLSLLRSETTFGMNRIYLMFDELGFSTSYFVAINTLVIEQSASEIAQLGMPKFMTWRARHWLGADRSILFLDTDYTAPATFSADCSKRIFEGGTVTYVALQLAYYMGFREVILVGVDHNYQTKGPANLEVVSEGEDPNHFDRDYFGKGFRWQLPDLEASEQAYSLARKTFESDGRRVLDATVGGKLTIFAKVDYLSLFGDAKR